MLSRVANYSRDSQQMVLWQELGTGAPTLMGFARLCSEALAANRQAAADELSEEARAILYAARRRGAIEIKGTDTAFDSSERLLAVCIELEADRQLILRRAGQPELTMRFLDGFRQLCASGLIMHHLFREFSLTRAGFELARTIARDQVRILDALAEGSILDEI